MKLPRPTCFSFSLPKMLSTLVWRIFRVCFKYSEKSYFSASFNEWSRYFTTEPSEIVKINLPLHLEQIAVSGGRRYFSLHLTQRNCCIENFLRLPLMSLRKCF